MKKELVMPDYNNSILNLITSILKKYNVESNHNELKQLKSIMDKEYNNIVLIVLDGMGSNIVEKNSPNGILFNSKISDITSVFPCTTTAAMNTYYSGKPPIETGWIAWSQYFKEYGKYVDMLPEIDSITGEKIVLKGKQVDDIIGYKSIYEKISEINTDIIVSEVSPSHCKKKTNTLHDANSVEEMCEEILKLCKNTDKNNFILAYNDDPDKTIHKFGCYSKEVKSFVLRAEKCVDRLIKELKGTKTLVLVSADHGHNDLKEIVSILDYPKLQDCFVMQPYLEPRCISFVIKEEKKYIFEKEFNKKFKGKYELYTKKEFLDSNILGIGTKHKKVDDFIGNYIAIAISDTAIVLENYLSKEIKAKYEKKSSHCGLTKNEMLVPLIVLDTDNM